MDIRKIQQKNEKSWILKTDYGKHLLIFSDFFESSCTPEIVLLLNQVARFLGLRISVSYPATNRVGIIKHLLK